MDMVRWQTETHHLVPSAFLPRAGEASLRVLDNIVRDGWAKDLRWYLTTEAYNNSWRPHCSWRLHSSWRPCASIPLTLAVVVLVGRSEDDLPVCVSGEVPLQVLGPTIPDDVVRKAAAHAGWPLQLGEEMLKGQDGELCLPPHHVHAAYLP